MKVIKRHWAIVLLPYCSIILLLGCAAIIEGAKGFAGVSTRSIEENRKSAIIKTIECDYNTCYNKAKEILARHIGAYIYAQDLKKHMLAVYVSGEDTTPVGLFFKEIDAANTQVEVSSPSTYAKEFIAGKVLPALEKEEKKGQADAKE